MQINIEVNETQFKDIVEKSLLELPKEKLQEVLLEGIKIYIRDSDMVKNLLTSHNGSYYGTAVDPSPFLKSLVLSSMPTDKLDDIRDEMLDVIRQNYDKILRDAIASLLINGICSPYNTSFRDAISQVLYEQSKHN